MANDWILDVLADLRNFATQNGLPQLADGLNDLSTVAAGELALRDQAAPHHLEREANGVGRIYRADGPRGDTR